MSASLSSSYVTMRPYLIEVEKRAQGALAAYASKRDFLVTNRVKSYDSILDKVETGRYKRLSDFDDLVALSLVVDTRNQISNAVTHIREIFNVDVVRDYTAVSDERLFVFDATRVYATLKLPGPPSPLTKIKFEVQVKTLLQHAWGKITHPLVYKPAKIEPKKIRLAAEVLAAFESIDRDLSRFSTTARYTKDVRGRNTKNLNRIAGMVDELIEHKHLAAELRPANIRRFAENVFNLIDRPRDNSEKAINAIEALYKSDAGKAASISLTQLAGVALLRAGLLRQTGAKAPYFFVSPELMALYPEVSKVTRRFELS